MTAVDGTAVGGYENSTGSFGRGPGQRHNPMSGWYLMRYLPFIPAFGIELSPTWRQRVVTVGTRQMMRSSCF